MKKLTYDEYLASLQTTEEGRTQIIEKESQLASKRYQSRFLLNRNIEQSSQLVLSQMSQKEYEDLRVYQMGQLYSAYERKETGGYPTQMDVSSSSDTRHESVRRVTGDRAGYIYNNGILALTQDDINAISCITRIKYHAEDFAYRRGAISLYSLKTVVDEICAIRQIALEELGDNPGELTIDKMCMQTNALKRAMGKVQGRNIFEIDDYNECARLQRTGKINQIMAKLGDAIEKALHPEDRKFNSNLLGNQETDIEI